MIASAMKATKVCSAPWTGTYQGKITDRDKQTEYVPITYYNKYNAHFCYVLTNALSTGNSEEGLIASPVNIIAPWLEPENWVEIRNFVE